MSLADGPQPFGKYTLLRQLASGGMAQLFVAVQRGGFGFEKIVVIKRILPGLTGDRALVEMFVHEARIAATLSHPNIVQIFDVGVEEDTYFIAMEHVHGEDIRSIVRQMKAKGVAEFPMEHALSVALGICSALTYAHEKCSLDGVPLHIVHRDVSPQNVIVAYAGEVKLVDFGIAQSDVMSKDQTTSGRLKGKIPYMSPEQARGSVIDRRSDIFAAGIILFELTTGRRLFKGVNEHETIELICSQRYPLPSEVRADYPPELEAIVMRALAKDPSERWQSARDMQSALEEYVRRERIPVTPIALSNFMHRLFEEKLEEQKAESAREVQAALAPEPGPTDAAPASSIGPTSSAQPVVVSPASRGVLMLGLGALAGLLLTGEIVWWTHQSPPPVVPPAAAAPAVFAGVGVDGGSSTANADSPPPRRAVTAP